MDDDGEFDESGEGSGDDDELGAFASDGSSVSASSGVEGAECGGGCAAFPTELEHKIYHCFAEDKMDIQYPLPDGLNLRSSLGSFPAGKFLCHAAPPLRAAHFFADFIDEEDKLQGEEDVRLDLLIGEYAPADFEDSDGGGPALWFALCGASPALARVVDLARQLALEVQSQLEAASAGQRVWPIGIQIPRAGAKKAAQQGVYELSFIAFALERPVEIAGDLVTLAAAAGRLPCALRGSNATFVEEGFAVKLILRPPTGALQSSAVRGLLWLPAAPDAAEEARLSWREAPPRVSRRTRRRGRKTKVAFEPPKTK